MSSRAVTAIDPSGLWPWVVIIPRIIYRCDETVVKAQVRIWESKFLVDLIDAAPGYDSMPFQHCYWNCQMTRRWGRSYAEQRSREKEELGKKICEFAEGLGKECFEGLSADFRETLVGYCCSAKQASDYKDNETGRVCGEETCFIEEFFTGYGCEQCCADSGVGLNEPDGPGTSRPCGPYMPEGWESLPGANSP